MADLDWHYLENQFDNATKKSKKRMKLIAQRHFDALAAAPASIKAALLARVTPPRTAFESKYNEWRGLLAQRAGALITFEQLLAKLSSTDIEDIDTAFKNVFKRTTPQYAVAFAGGRDPYQSGSDDERVDALALLFQRVNDLGEGSLDGVADQIEAVLGPLQAANAAAGQKEAGAEQARTQIEPLRVALAVALYQNLGQLMLTLGPSEEIAAFYDLELLRQTGPEEEEVIPEPPTPPVPPVTP